MAKKKDAEVVSSVEIGHIPTMGSGQIAFQYGVRDDGSQFIDVRHTIEIEGERKFTRKGVTFPIQHISEIAKLFNDIESVVKENENG